jgi:cytochrome c oxidase subunit 1
MGTAYYLVPRLSGRDLELGLLAKVQPYLWFLGMVLFSFVNHVTGLMGMPRRIFTDTYNGAPQAQIWQGLTRVSALGGVVLFASAGLFVMVIVGTLLAGARKPQPALEWAEPLGVPDGGHRVAIWDKLGLWFAMAVALAAIAYVIPLWDLLHLTRYGSMGYKPF